MRSLYVRPLEQPPPLAANATFEWASRDLGGDFSFERLIVEGRSHHWVTARSTLRARLLLGIAGGEVPAQKRFFLGGLGTLRAYEEKEFDGEGMALANVEWAVRLARLLPLVIPFADAGATWDGSQTTDGLRADLGLGLRWPPSGPFFARVDGAVAVTRGGSGPRVTGLVQFPF
jgi:hemolysin activation/secretion protein